MTNHLYIVVIIMALLVSAILKAANNNITELREIKELIKSEQISK